MRPTSRSVRAHVIAGTFVIVGALGGVAAFAAATPLAGAVVAPGAFVVDGAARVVRHPTGGVVAELLTREGDAVAAGDLLLRLDDAQPRAALGVVEAELTAALLRRARLLAERDGAAAVAPLDGPASAAAERLLADERRLMAARAARRAGEVAALDERSAQIREEISGWRAQSASLAEQAAVVETELALLRDLLARGLVQRPRVVQIEREAIRLRGALAEAAARVAQAEARAGEARVQAGQVRRAFEAEVAAELREVETRIAGLEERRRAALDALGRSVVRAPADGLVHRLAVNAAGAVVGAGEAILSVVPTGEDLLLEVRVSPWDVERVRLGGPARVRLSALPGATTPEVAGSVARRGADVVFDERTGAPHFVVAVRLAPGEAERLAPRRILPGMPAEAFLVGAQRTLAEELARPLVDRLRRALREE